MDRKRFAQRIAAGIASLLLTACPFDTASETGNGIVGEVNAVRPYRVEDDRIIELAHSDTSFYCEGSNLRFNVSDNGPDTLHFLISGRTLTLYSRVDTTASGALFAKISILTRIGSNSGLEGAWKFIDVDYKLFSGTFTAEEKADHDSGLVWDRHFLAFVESNAEIADGKITSYLDVRTADQFMERWDGAFDDRQGLADSLGWDMAAKAVDQYTVEFTGRKTGETVRVRTMPTGDVTYTSDQPGHDEHRFHRKPTSCPNETHPQWYSDFRTDNSKNVEGTAAKVSPLGKFAGIHLKTDLSTHFPFIPLKNQYPFLN